MSANTLLDAIINMQDLKHDSDLSGFLKVSPPLISKIRTGRNGVGPAVILRVHETTGMPVAEIRELIAQ